MDGQLSIRQRMRNKNIDLRRTANRPPFPSRGRREGHAKSNKTIFPCFCTAHDDRKMCIRDSRYTAKYLALSLGLTGWARNEWDGTVTMEVQGREALINKLLVGLNQNQFISIEWIDTKEIPLEEEKAFTCLLYTSRCV